MIDLAIVVEGATEEMFVRSILKAYLQNKELDGRFVFPYVQVYEFEGLLFSNVDVFKEEFDQAPVRELRAIRSKFPTPEDINDSAKTAPSRRIRNLIGQRYQKSVNGPSLAAKIGLDTIREECRRFDEWLTRLENLPRLP